MTPEILRLKLRFDTAMDEYIRAIRDCRAALGEALTTESIEVNQIYLQKCADQQAKEVAYHAVATELREAVVSYRRQNNC